MPSWVYTPKTLCLLLQTPRVPAHNTWHSSRAIYLYNCKSSAHKQFRILLAYSSMGRASGDADTAARKCCKIYPKVHWVHNSRVDGSLMKINVISVYDIIFMVKRWKWNIIYSLKIWRPILLYGCQHWVVIVTGRYHPAVLPLYYF